MSDYTKVNLKDDVENSALGFGLGDHLETRFARKALGLEQLGFSYQKMRPGFRQPFGHRHAEQEEVYLVLEGSGRAKLDDGLVELAQWDAIRIAPRVMRAFEAGDEGMTLLAIGAGAGGDGEMVNGWWAD